MKKFLLSALMLIVVGGAVGWAVFARRAVPVSTNGKPTIVVSMFHIAEWTRAVAGDEVVIVTATPPGIEPHEFTPSPREMAGYLDADLVIGSGGGVDPWAEKLALERKNSGQPSLILANNLTLVDNDPHYWLDPVMAQTAVDEITSSLSALMPDKAAAFAANAVKEKAALADLDSTYKATLDTCPRKDIVVAHDAFGYLARRYGLVAHSVLGLSPEDEPSAQELAAIVRDVPTWGVKVIFFETLASPRVAQTLADELHVQTGVLNPIEGLAPDQLTGGVTYDSLMADNLRTLYDALCQK